MTIQAKICGLSTPESVAAAVAGGAAYVGFVFFARSPRNLEPEAAARLAAPLRQGPVRTVAVTVDPDDALVDRLMATLKPDLIQVHGQETPSGSARSPPAPGAGVIKAFSVSSAADVDQARAFDGVAEHLMFDARPLEGSPCPAAPAQGSTGACWKAGDFLARISWPEGWIRGTWPRRSRPPARRWWTFPLASSGVPA
jgi:phosphoribosylanthranilate isomerase